MALDVMAIGEINALAEAVFADDEDGAETEQTASENEGLC